MNELTIFAGLLATVAMLTPAAAGPGGPSHHDHTGFSAGVPGDPKKPARIIQVSMNEGEGKIMYVPSRVEIKRGAQIKFILRNNGALDHELFSPPPKRMKSMPRT